ncbi:unnamed protein product [Brugia pahangi]|uniref:Ovule protein n=1 Tax=Brugia pahangi TaxID=6280 RepID=A0A0N4TKR8_BRUPA|nr:unnamed protein product [Brugia pahangi]
MCWFYLTDSLRAYETHYDEKEPKKELLALGIIHRHRYSRRRHHHHQLVWHNAGQHCPLNDHLQLNSTCYLHSSLFCQYAPYSV